jgi:uncharacterized phage-associated protein
MNRTKFDPIKARNTIALVMQRLGGTVDYEKLLKLLYFIERRHISIWGQTVFGGKYIAMPRGPVNSEVYDAIRHVVGHTNEHTVSFPIIEEVLRHTKGKNLTLTAEPDLEELSRSAVSCITSIITEYGDLTVEQLSELSHDEAYRNAKEAGRTLSFIEMAGLENASPELIDYIKFRNEINELFR